MTAPVSRILVLGGYGVFGGRVLRRLAHLSGIELLVAGRSEQRARAFADSVSKAAAAIITPLQIDAAGLAGQELAQLRALVVVNAAGPYQTQGYGLARACVAAGCHYIDLADARAHVGGIGILDAEAKAAGVLVVSGASTVPGLSSAVVDAFAGAFAALEEVMVVISPGNSFDPGLATTQSILGSLGRPIPSSGGCAPQLHGWQPLERRTIVGLGKRWTGACDVPDLELFPRRYPGLRCVRVLAGLEVGAFHIGLWALSWLVRSGIVSRPEKLAAPLLAVKRGLARLGSDCGGMSVTLEGRDQGGARKHIEWSLVARQGHGPYVPATPAVLLTKRLLAGTLAIRGAIPCLGLFTLNEFMDEIEDLDISAGVT